MSKTIFFLTVLIMIALCNSKTKKADLIAKMVQMNQDAGCDKDQVQIILTGLEESTKNFFESVDKEFETNLGRCNQGKGLLDDYVKQLEADVTSLQARMNEAHNSLSSTHASFEEHTHNLQDATKAREAILASVITSNEVFNENIREAQEKITVLRELKNIATDELMNPEAPTSFVQMKAFHGKVNKMKSMIKNSKDLIYGPLLNTLVQLTAKDNFANQEILKKILTALRSFEDNVQKFISDSTAAHQRELGEAQDAANTKAEQIASLGELVAQARSDIAFIEHSLELGAKAVEMYHADIKRKSDELASWNETCQHTERSRENYANNWKSLNSAAEHHHEEASGSEGH